MHKDYVDGAKGEGLRRKTDQRMENAGDSHATAMNITIKRIINKRVGLQGC